MKAIQSEGGETKSYTEYRGSRSENEREFLVLSPSSSEAASNSVCSADRGFFLPSTSGCALSGQSVASAGYQALVWGHNKHFNKTEVQTLLPAKTMQINCCMEIGLCKRRCMVALFN